MITHASVKQKHLENPEIKKEYDALAPEFELWKNLIELRIKKGLSQKEIAEKLGTKQSAISRIENGTANPSLALLKRIADALGKKLVISFQ